MAKLFLSFFLFSVSLSLIGQAVTDIDGNEYPIVTIGGQNWFAKNLEVTKYNDGSSITFIDSLETTLWSNTSDGAFCNSVYNYGALYNHYAVSTEKLCPKGWRVPSSEDFENLSQSVDSLHELVDSLGWPSYNKGGNNISGFSILPAGWRFHGGGYWFSPDRASFWTSTQCTGNDCYDYYNLWYFDGPYANEGGFGRNYGASVRCTGGIITSSNELKNDFNLNIYPNPTNGPIKLGQRFENIFIKDLSGKLVYSCSNSSELDITLLNNGTYILQVVSSGLTVTKKIIKIN